jgi:adenylate kinase family enzyme
MKAIFILTGLPNSGRDTFAKFIHSKVRRSVTISYMTELNSLIKDMFPLEPTKRQIGYINKIKELLVYSNLVTYHMIKKIKRLDTDKTIFFLKVNNPTDIAIIRRTYPKKVKVVYIDRGLKWDYVNYLPQDFKYNYKVNNTGTLDEFKTNVNIFINQKVPSKLFYDKPSFNINTEEHE